MPIKIDFPGKIEGYVEQVPMFLTPVREPDVKRMQVLSKVFRMSGDVVDQGSFFAMRSADSILHQFHASDSIRWLSEMHKSGRDTEVLKVTDKKELRAIADKFLAETELSDKRASFSSIIFGQTEILPAGSKVPKAVNTCAYANYIYSLAGLPVLGPGAKIQVLIGPEGKPIGCYRFWREVKDGKQTRATLSTSAVQEIFQNYPGFAQLKEGSKVVVERARLGYMTLPPRAVQGALIPVVEFQGLVSTPAIEKTKFIHSVIAINYKDEELKLYRVSNKHFGGTCRVL